MLGSESITPKDIPRRKAIRIWMAVLMMVVGSFHSYLAFAEDNDFYSGNDILFYDPKDTCSTHSAAIGTANLVGNSNAEMIWNFLVGNDGTLPTDQWLSAEQAAGIMGNLQQESQFKPDAQEGNGIGYGIAQWSFGRRTQLEKAASDQGVPVSDLGFQLKYLYQEATSRRAIRGSGTEWEVLKTQTTVEDALVFWHDTFERSADSPSKVISVRGGYAQNAYTSFKSNTPQGGATTSGSSDACGSTGAVTGDLATLVKSYAWPDYKPVPYIQKQPAYDAAIQKAQSEGKYIGGIRYPGIDCGGFVTTLLVNSGFDPNYNHGGVISNGAGSTATQEAWAKANWQTLGNGASINVADLKPGDVAFEPGHTFVFVGNIDGFNGTVASASLDERAPMAGRENPTSGTVTWYRKK